MNFMSHIALHWSAGIPKNKLHILETRRGAVPPPALWKNSVSLEPEAKFLYLNLLRGCVKS